MTIGNHTAQLAEEESGETIEIDIDFIRPNLIEKTEVVDPFAKSVDTTRFQKNAPIQKAFKDQLKLQKRLSGVDGAATKYKDPEQVIGYSVFGVVEPPYDPVALGQLYDESGILHSVVDARVMNTVGLGISWIPTLKAKKQIEKAAKKEDVSGRVRDNHQKVVDELNEIIENLNEEETFIETMVRVWLDVLTIGYGFLEIGRTTSGKIGYIGQVPATLTRVRRDRDGYVQMANGIGTFFRNFGDKDTPDPINGDPNPNEIIMFKLYTPNNTFYGIPPSVAAIHAIIGDKFAKEYNIDYFENKAIPRYAIILKGVKLSEKSKKELIQYFRNEIKGKNHGTLVVPIPATIASNQEADIKFEKLETEVQEGSFDKYRKANRDEIVTTYRVPPTKIGILDNANLAVSRDADRTFKTQVVGPDQTIAAKKINRIIKEFTDLFMLEFTQLDIIDEDTKSRIHDRYARIQVLDPNEIRTDIGKQPRAGGSKVLPYPIKTGYQEGKPWPSKDAVEGTAATKISAEAKAQENNGAPVGNSNAKSGSPPKSGQDNGSNKSDAVETGTKAERGQAQDENKVRERN
jgi:PBSX family phage portal protein